PWLLNTYESKENLVTTATFVTSTATVAFEEDKILPTPHSQEDAPDDGKVMCIRRIERHLSRRAAWKVVAGGIVRNVDDGDGPTSRHVRSHVLKRSGRLELSGRDRIEYVLHLPFQDLSRQAVKGDFCLISGAHALQRILLEAGG